MPTRRRPAISPTSALAQTYLRRFEPGTPRAPAKAPVAQQVRAQQDVGADVQRQPQQPNFFQRLLATLGGPVYPGPSLAARIGGPLTEPIRPGGFGEAFREAYRPRGLTDIFGENIALTLGQDKRNIATQAHNRRDYFWPTLQPGRPLMGRNIFGAQEGVKRSYRTTASMLSRGVYPPFISFGAQEFLSFTDENMLNQLLYDKVPGGWVRREESNQPLNNVYGGGGYAQPETITVNYGGGGGGGGSSRQSSYLVNWRI